MSKLYIYGDSFSDYYTPELLYHTAGTVDKFWFEIVQEHFNLELVHRAVCGYGWQRINHKILQDWNKWEKDDLIIICPSYFSRVDIVDFSVAHPMECIYSPWIADIDDFDKRYNFVQESWYNTVKFIRKQGYRVCTWALEAVDKQFNDIIVPPPAGTKSWYDWVLSDKEYWIVPFPHFGGDAGSIIEKDTHLSDTAGKILAQSIIEYIENEKI